MIYSFMDQPMIKADLVCLESGSHSPVSFTMVEKYNTTISLDNYKEYFQALAKQKHGPCTIESITIRASQHDDKGRNILDPSHKDEEIPLWQVVYHGEYNSF